MSVTLHRFRGGARANEAIHAPLTHAEKAAMIRAAATKLEELFDVLRIDHRNDHNTRDTPRRVAKMYVEDLMDGRFSEPPAVTAFENVGGFAELIVTGPIEVRSTCAHHLMPIYGEAFVGVLPHPEGKIIGLSKYDRIVGHFSSRLQIQEELVQQIGAYIMEKTSPRGLAVRVNAVHMCKTHRGVRASHRSRMVTCAYFGELAADPVLKAQFLQECTALEGRM
ncbi:MAG: GTP cyclohydrolase I [Janthinobacterium lividum]